MLRSVDWWLATDVSGQPFSPIFKGQAIFCFVCKWDNNLEREIDCLTLEDWTDRLCLNVGNYQSMLRNILEERRSNLHQGGKPEIKHLGDVIFNK
jgi:hypothetical protein